MKSISAPACTASGRLRYYFDKSVSELMLPEAALIAGLAQNAGLHSPYRPEAPRRRNTVCSAWRAG